ncbi:MAG: 2-hydroxy-acid oxidase [bacterium]|nr:MAG: 2-hydroxy-acid oxidase [bacterium]
MRLFRKLLVYFLYSPYEIDLTMIPRDITVQLSDFIDSERFSVNESDLKSVACDESSLDQRIPSLLVYPVTSEEVSKLVILAYAYEIKITARGSGTSLEGNSIPEAGGMVLDLSRMNRIIEIREDDLQVTVEPGIIYNNLNESLKEYGLFFPPSPGGSSGTATIGGMVSTNASGIYSVKYGGTRESILKVKVVTGTGEILEFGNHCFKSSSGYHMVGLICGSEGTLAIVTEITLRLKGIPENYDRFAYSFSEELQAVSAISEMMKYALDIAALEYLDRYCIESLNQLKSYGLEEKPVVFFELQGSECTIKETKDYIHAISKDYGGQIMTLTREENPWEIRQHTTTAISHRKKGTRIIRNDIAFPISKLPDIVEKCYQKAKNGGLMVHTFGHVGLGILHVLCLADPNNPEEWAKAEAFNKEIIEYAIEVGGSTSGEHGIGLSLKPYMEKEHGMALEMMKSIKKLFDPKNILNPSKIFP